MMSGGCHELLRENGAICVTDGAEIAELAGQIGADLRPERTPAPPTLFDTLDEVEAAVTEALPLRNGATIQNVARTAGLTIELTMAKIGRASCRGREQRAAGGGRGEAKRDVGHPGG